MNAVAIDSLAGAVVGGGGEVDHVEDVEAQALEVLVDLHLQASWS